MFHRVRWLIFVAFVWLNIAWSQPSTQLIFPSDGQFVLPSEPGSRLLNQCSREAPIDVSGYWTPSADAIRELEALLTRFLREREINGTHVPPRGVAYHRQYIGFVKNGTRQIYGNFYPAEPRFKGRERTAPVIICDGGAHFWGIVFQVDTKRFEEPQFNGEA